MDKKYVKLASVESYDPATGKWSPEPPMLTARYNCGVEEAAVRAPLSLFELPLSLRVPSISSSLCSPISPKGLSGNFREACRKGFSRGRKGFSRGLSCRDLGLFAYAFPLSSFPCRVCYLSHVLSLSFFSAAVCLLLRAARVSHPEHCVIALMYILSPVHPHPPP